MNHPAKSKTRSAGTLANTRQDLCALVVLVTLGVAARLLLRDIPNFAPVMGIALFAGFVMQRASLAIAAPLAVMVISDQVLGGYEFGMMIVVYTMLAAPVLLRPVVRTLLVGKQRSRWARGSALMGISVGASVTFFLVTNLAVWVQSVSGASPMAFYDASIQGLLHCYGQALPFFRYTLAGDLCFTTGLFGSWALVVAAIEGNRLKKLATSGS
ncbi:MAG: DUF6580 family putative transport protein [Pirellulaceae bacterium]